MTIILATKREKFAVLAADQMHGGGRPGCRPKVVLHPSLPLAFAVGGLMSFRVGSRDDDATTHVREFADTITYRGELVVSEIAERMRVLFQPSMDQAKDSMHVFIALVKDGKADAGAQRVTAPGIGSPPTKFIDDRYYAYIPPMLETFYKNGRHLLAMHDEAVTAEREVARRAREAIDAGITEERVLDADGKNKVIGGIPDVVLVNAAGASPLI